MTQKTAQEIPELVYVGLGSNLDNPLKQLKNALFTLKQNPLIKIVHISSFYQSKAWGNVNQSDFINAVVAITTNYTPFELLDELQKIENSQGRVRFAHKIWQPRTLDLDILLFGRRIISSEKLVIPHHLMHLRRFVLEPLCEIAPNIVLPNHQKCQDLLQLCKDEQVTKLPKKY